MTLEEAKNFLRQILRCGPVLSSEIVEEAQRIGINQDVLRQARIEMEIVLLSENGNRYWSLGDIHRTTAARMFNVCYEEVTDEQRKIAKRRNFQSAYGVPESPESQRHTDALWVALSGIRRSTTSWGHIGGGTRRGI